MHQDDLFAKAEERTSETPVDQVMDAIEEKFGTRAVVRGRGFGVELKRQGPSRGN